jgi:two-component sensor histidine kinase
VSMTVGDDGAVSLVVADNGRGYDTAHAAAAPSKGLGSNIIKGLLAQLRGTMSVHNEGGARSEIRVAGPMAA